MKFRISRSSQGRWGYDPEDDEEVLTPPCTGAVFDEKQSAELYQYVWTMEVNETQLLDFMKLHGQIIVGPFDEDTGLFELEIYDSWRE